MRVTLSRGTYLNKVYGVGLCVLRRNNVRHLCMAVQAGELKKLVRVVSARKWLSAQGCPPELARQLVSVALEKQPYSPPQPAESFAQMLGHTARLKNG